MNILAINPGHNGSVAFLVNGEIEFYIEEERLSREKYDGNPYLGILKAIPYGIDVLILGGTTNDFPKLPWTGEDPYSALVRKHNKNVKVIYSGNDHHLGHAAAAFYNSGFQDAVAVIVDGAGSYISVPLEENNKNINSGYETETIYNCEYPAKFDMKFKNISGNDTRYINADNVFMDNSISIVKSYEAVSDYLGFGFIEAGKTMGLAPYGKNDPEIPPLFMENKRGNKNMFMPNYPAGAYVEYMKHDRLNLTELSNDWHNDSSKVTDAAKNLAWKVQHETQELVGDFIEKAVNMTGKTNVVIAGGYGLNCVANYYLQKRFPELNIWIDPISHDGGTSIGLAKLYWHSKNNDETIRKMKSLYLGQEVSTDYDNILNDYETLDVTAADVAKLISEKNIVALFQGKSEAGPRALGNRSILYDPTDVNGKDHVNKVKGREWFRPFAGSMLQEYFEEWFETAGLEESPYMMYAIDFKTSKHGEVPAITHVDGTCRIQTVTKDQNTTYYELIDEFRKITGVPILFNTSFNLAGEPLVETLEDAMKTIRNSDIEYCYLPEVGKVVIYRKNDMVEINTELETEENTQ